MLSKYVQKMLCEGDGNSPAYHSIKTSNLITYKLININKTEERNETQPSVTRPLTEPIIFGVRIVPCIFIYIFLRSLASTSCLLYRRCMWTNELSWTLNEKKSETHLDFLIIIVVLPKFYLFPNFVFIPLCLKIYLHFVRIRSLSSQTKNQYM